MDSTQEKIIQQIADEVQGKLDGGESGHDWWHILRVWNLAQRIGVAEGGDMFVVELAAILHDIADWKFHNGDDTIGPKTARTILQTYAITPEVVSQVSDIIAHLSFKGAGVPTDMATLEGKIVQDADRLDALGAIGIARAFAYSGGIHRPIYDPGLKPSFHATKEAYFADRSTTVNHFYEKTLLLKDRMNTKTAKQLAEGRHHFIEEYLSQFFQEWEGKI